MWCHVHFSLKRSTIGEAAELAVQRLQSTYLKVKQIKDGWLLLFSDKPFTAANAAFHQSKYYYLIISLDSIVKRMMIKSNILVPDIYVCDKN